MTPLFWECSDKTYLDLFKWDFKAKRLVVVRVEGVLLDCRLLLLQPLAVLHQVDLHIWICIQRKITFSHKEEGTRYLTASSDRDVHDLLSENKLHLNLECYLFNKLQTDSNDRWWSMAIKNKHTVSASQFNLLVFICLNAIWSGSQVAWLVRPPPLWGNQVECVRAATVPWSFVHDIYDTSWFCLCSPVIINPNWTRGRV